MSKKILKAVSGGILGVALCFSSTVAMAKTVPVAPVQAASAYAPMSISPFVALSAYGTMQSRSAVCATAVGAAGVAAAGQPAPGCVLPVVDPVAPVAVEAAPVPVAPVAAAGFGLGIGALLAGLVAVAAIAAVLLSGNDDGRLPISPS